MTGYRWRSLIHELIWYLSGEHHIQNLRNHTKIWDAWATEDGYLDTAYGRFWRHYPIPDTKTTLKGETWAGITNTKWDDNLDIDPSRWINEKPVRSTVDKKWETRKTFDQIQYVIDILRENPQSRRLVINAWHPANATVSTLPPCHFSFVFNVQGDQLNCHLTQRSGDIALGIPFNIAAYSILTHLIAQEANLEVGSFSHTVVDAHIYCGTGKRGEWYNNNMQTLQQKLNQKDSNIADIENWLEKELPNETEEKERLDHVPGLIKQIQREPLKRPEIKIPNKPIDNVEFDDIQLEGYQNHPAISFEVAE